MSKLSLEKEEIRVERMSSQCEDLRTAVQQDMAQLSELTAQQHRETVTQMQSAVERVQQTVLETIHGTSVIAVSIYLPRPRRSCFTCRLPACLSVSRITEVVVG